jgi:hypothetical protein
MRTLLCLVLLAVSADAGTRSLAVSGPLKTVPTGLGASAFQRPPALSLQTLPAAAFAAPNAALPALPAAAAGAAQAQAQAKAGQPAAVLTHNPALAASAQVRAVAAAASNGAAFVPAASARVFDGDMRRPVVESWTVDGKSYGSTAELVKALPRSAGPVDAVYSFSDGKKPEPPRQGANTAIGAFAGMVFGSIIMAVVGALFSAFSEVVSIITFNPQGGMALSEMGILVLFGAALGSIVGASSLFKASKAVAVDEKFRHGRIFRQAGPEGETILFETRLNTVDLGKFAQAPIVKNPGAPAPWPAWKSALAGLGLGAAATAAYFLPLVNIAAFFIVPAAVAAVFGAKTAGTGLRGGLLGGAVGAVLTVGTLAAQVNVQPWTLSLAGVAAALAVLGAVLGLWGANAWRAQAAEAKALEPSGQWWTERDED